MNMFPTKTVPFAGRGKRKGELEKRDVRRGGLPSIVKCSPGIKFRRSEPQ